MTNPAPDAPPPPAPADPYAPPTAALNPYAGHAPAEEAPSLGPRVAGGLLLVNAALVFAEFGLGLAAGPSSAGGSTPFDSPGRGVVSAFIDIGIGISLLAGNRRVVPWAIARAALGLVLLTAIIAFKDPYLAVVQVMMCGSLLALLIGNPGKPRVAVGAMFFGLYAMVSLVGLASTVTGKNPIASLMLGASGDIETAPAGVVTGEASHYRITAPSDKWHLRKPEAARKDNALADRWLTRPDVDAHVLVIAERSPKGLFAIEPLADLVEKNAKDTSSSFKLHSRTRLKTYPEDGRLLHLAYTTSGLDIVAYTGVVAAEDRAYQIMAFASSKVFPEVEAELRGMVESFQLPSDEQRKLTEDLEPAPASRVEGTAVKYTLTAPGDKWHVRKPEVAKKDNELADLWLVRPDKDAHAIVIAEEMPNTKFDIEVYTDAVIAALKNTAPGANVLSREPMRTSPNNGRLLHVSASMSGMELEYYYGVYVQGQRGFQVIAWASKDFAEGVREDLVKICEGFGPPPAK